MVRTLFTQETLEISSFKDTREEAKQNVQRPEAFKWELKCYLDNEPNKDLNHLKNAAEALTYLVFNEDDDIDLMKRTLKMLNSYESLSNKAKTTIGNLYMRALYIMNEPDKMKEVKFHNHKNDYNNGTNLIIIFFFFFSFKMILN